MKIIIITTEVHRYFYKNYRMSVIIVLLIASVSIASLFLAALMWSIKNGQFEDEYSPPRRILFDDQAINKSTTTNNNN